MRRANGSGQVYTKHGAYYGRWRTPSGGRVNRKLGPARKNGTSEGLTRTQAEQRLRVLMDERAHVGGSGVTVSEAGERLAAFLAAKGRKASHVESVRSHVRIHLERHFEAKPIDRIAESDVEALLAGLQRRGKSPKTIRNILGTLHSVFEYARRRRWVTGNPVSLVDLPTGSDPDPDIRFFDGPELEALLRAGPDGRADAWWPVERVLYLTAAMSGLRQGELIGLRWRDVDWVAGKIRVRQSFVRGEFGAPKSKRSTRAVPMHDRVAGELDRHFQHSVYDADEDLVFAHPHTGRPLDRSKVLKRFKKACGRAGVRQLRFHDLRHTFGTRMAAAGVPMRTLQEWLGHRDFKTTLIYADYAPSADERTWITRAFDAKPDGVQTGSKAQPTGTNSDPLEAL